jgi:mannitol/fructose-specific phosphotransferase system IIA component (Ntr-type)
MHFWKQFKPKTCSVGLKATSKEDALREVVENLVKGEGLLEAHGTAAMHALTEREKLASTGVGNGVAIPHVKLAEIDRVVCSLSVHKEGLEWAAVDGAPVHILFTVLRPDRAGDHHDPEKHLEMMRWIAKLGRDADFCRFAQRAKTKTALIDLLREMSAV